MRLLPALIVSALLGIVYWVGATLFTDRIQNDITERSNEAITQFKPDVDVAVDGRDVTLTGLVNTQDRRDEAKEVVDAVWGVRASQNFLQVRDPYNFQATYSPNGMNMSGYIDNQDAIDRLIHSIAPVVPSGSVSITARPMVNSGQKLALGAEALLLLKNGELIIDEEKLSLTGETDTEDTKNAIVSKLTTNQAFIDPLVVFTDINVNNSMSLACRTALDSVMERDSVLFAVDQSIVTDRYHNAVQDWANMLEICPGIVLLEGHADQDGNEEYNHNLSQRRSDAVAQLLIESGIASERLQSFSYGETRPVASNESHHDKSYNRRVDLEYIHTLLPFPTAIQQPIISSQSAE